jgi:hypothetical protein
VENLAPFGERLAVDDADIRISTGEQMAADKSTATGNQHLFASSMIYWCKFDIRYQRRGIGIASLRSQ